MEPGARRYQLTFVQAALSELNGGLSHCEVEESSAEDIEAGVNVLLGAALRLAGG